MPSEVKEEKQLWTSILNDVTAHTRTRHLPKRHVILFGDEGSGKSSLISRIQGKPYNPDEHPLGTGLEYTYFDVRDEETEDVIGRLGVYTLDGNEQHKSLLQFVCKEEDLERTTLMICLDYSKPWRIMESLKKWISVIENFFSQFENTDNMQKMKENLKRYFQRFVDGQFDSDANKGETEDDSTLIPLEENVLTVNFGVPVVIVMTKMFQCDTIVTLRKDYDLQGQHIDFIQMKLRQYCMRYGAALVYTGRDGSNSERLYRYLLHRVYGFSLKDKADITKPETTFIPSAWDSQAKISILQDGFKTIDPSQPFEEVVRPPLQQKVKEEVIQVQDEQQFLKQQQTRLGRSTNFVDSSVRRDALKQSRPGLLRPSSAAVSSIKPASAVTSHGNNISQKSPLGGKHQSPSANASLGIGNSAISNNSGMTSSPASAERTPARPSSTTSGKGVDASQNDVLANFFNNLLQKPATPQRTDTDTGISSVGCVWCVGCVEAGGCGSLSGRSSMLDGSQYVITTGSQSSASARVPQVLAECNAVYANLYDSYPRT
eukprot:gene8539-987_t